MRPLLRTPSFQEFPDCYPMRSYSYPPSHSRMVSLWPLFESFVCGVAITAASGDPVISREDRTCRNNTALRRVTGPRSPYDRELGTTDHLAARKACLRPSRRQRAANRPIGNLHALRFAT